MHAQVMSEGRERGKESGQELLKGESGRVGGLGGREGARGSHRINMEQVSKRACGRACVCKGQAGVRCRSPDPQVAFPPHWHKPKRREGGRGREEARRERRRRQVLEEGGRERGEE